jgi:hypothetical protein
MAIIPAVGILARSFTPDKEEAEEGRKEVRKRLNELTKTYTYKCC